MGNYKSYENANNAVEIKKGEITLHAKQDENINTGYCKVNSKLFPLATELYCVQKFKLYSIIFDDSLELNECVFDENEKIYNFLPVISKPNMYADEIHIKVDLRYDEDVKDFLLLNTDIDTHFLLNKLQTRNYFFESESINISHFINKKLFFYNLKIDIINYNKDNIDYFLKCGLVNKETKFFFLSTSKVINLTGSNVIDTNKAKFPSKEEFIGMIREQIAGKDDLLASIYDNFLLPRSSIKKFQDLDIKLEPGFLFDGPPGTGKSRLAELICKSVYGKFMFVQGPELKDSFVGETEKNIRQIFDAPRKDLRSNGTRASMHVVCIDEIDSILPKRNVHSENHNNSMTTQFLSCLTYDFPANLILIGTTNFRKSIDSAALRSGRLGKIFRIALPDYVQRTQIFKLYLDKIPSNYKNEGEFVKSLEKFGTLSSGFCGADIEMCINELKIAFVEKNLDKITAQNVEEYVNKKKLEKNMFNYLIWNDKVKDFVNQVIYAYEHMSAGNFLIYNVYGHGLCSLAKYIANQLSIKCNYIKDDDLEYEESIIISKRVFEITNFNLAMKFKMNNLKLVILNKCSSSNDEIHFSIPKIKSKEDLEKIKEKFGDKFNLKDITFPVYFSKLFKNLN